MLAMVGPLPQWANFLAMAGVILLVAVGSLIWFLAFRTKRKRKRRHHHRERRPLNPTLDQTSGLPPRREPNPPAE
ncbi:MAG: hypothetical protein WDN00_16095 [Limisphaerales bacterium]